MSVTRATACPSASSTRRSSRAARWTLPIGMRVALRPGVVAAGGSRSCARSSASPVRSRAGRMRPKDFVQVYVPIAQDLVGRHLPGGPSRVGKADALAPAVRAAISRIDKEQLVSIRDVVTLEDIDWAATGRHRFRAAMVGAFAVLALCSRWSACSASSPIRCSSASATSASAARSARPRNDVLRLVVSERGSRDRHRRRDRVDPVGGLQSMHDVDVVWRRRWTSRPSRP